MILPASTEEGKLLKKRYAVFEQAASTPYLRPLTTPAPWPEPLDYPSPWPYSDASF